MNEYLWIWLVLLYGTLKGAREICKKKALQTCSSIEVLLIYSLIAFLLVIHEAPEAIGMEPRFFLPVIVKSFVIFIAWICSFTAIKQLPISLYGVLDLSRVLFATLLGVCVLGERMGIYNIIGLVFVCLGLLMLKFNPLSLLQRNKQNSTVEDNKDSRQVAPVIVVLALISCMLNAVSGLMDKILMKDITSAQLQFWYMFFLCIFYTIYAVASKEIVNTVKTLKNKWIWLLAIMFVIADRALFVANGMEQSQVTVMTLLKQAGCIVTILAGKFVFKEKRVGYKLVCAAVIIFGIVMGVMK